MSEPLSSPNLKQDLIDSFDAATLQRAKKYQQQGHVLDYDISTDGFEALVGAVVRGSNRNRYEVTIKVTQEFGGYLIDADCTCPVGFNCKHAAAVLFEIVQLKKIPAVFLRVSDTLPDILSDEKLDNQTSQWLNRFLTLAEQDNTGTLKKAPDEEILFVVDLAHKTTLSIKTEIAKRLKDGRLGKTYAFTPNTDA